MGRKRLLGNWEEFYELLELEIGYNGVLLLALHPSY